MTERFVAGGMFMWPILIVFCIGLILALVKFITLMTTGVNAGQLMQKVKKALMTGDTNAAIKACKGNKPVQRILTAGLENKAYGVDAVEKGLVQEGGIQSTYLNKGMIWLSTVTAMAPMLGFLGTVWGMVGAMESIAKANDISPAVVAGGISEALLTTAFGLVVALTIQFFQNVFANIIDNRILDMEESSIALLDTVMELEHNK